MQDCLNRQPTDAAIKHKYYSGAKTCGFSNKVVTIKDAENLRYHLFRQLDCR